jgi:hypothetical protein
MGMHYMFHQTNRAVQALSNLSLVSKIETLLNALHSYFTSSPKMHMKFTKLAKIMKQMDLRYLAL